MKEGHEERKKDAKKEIVALLTVASCEDKGKTTSPALSTQQRTMSQDEDSQQNICSAQKAENLTTVASPAGGAGARRKGRA